MRGAAWLMLASTWSVIVFFTAWLFWKVLAMPARPGERASGEPGVEPEPEARAVPLPAAQRPGA